MFKEVASGNRINMISHILGVFRHKVRIKLLFLQSLPQILRFVASLWRPISRPRDVARSFSSSWSGQNSTVCEFTIPRSSNFNGCVGKISGEEDRFHLPPMGFLPSETRLEIFFDFDLFSCSNK